MHDHEFEKQVHQKMEGLHLEPSDAVWRRVEGQLHKKKRRRIVFWIPLLLAVLCTGGYLLYNDFYTHTAAYVNNSALPSSDNKKAETKKIGTAAKKSSTAPSGSLQQTGGPLVGRENRKQAVVLKNTPHTPIKHISHNKNKRTGENTDADLSSKQQAIAFTKPMREERQLHPLAEPVPIQTDFLSSNEPVAAVVPLVSYAHEPFSTLFADPSGKNVALQTVRLSSSKKFSWGIHAELIRTSIYDGSLSKLFNDQSMTDQVWASQSAIGNLNNGGSAVIYIPSVVHAATGFSAGFFLRKEIGSRLSLSTGVDYTLYRTSMQIGSSRNSSTVQFNYSRVSQYFLPVNGSDSHAHTNNYHFIGLPLLLQVQLNKTKLPIVWEGGIELARLLGSNALNYSNRLNGYYKDNQLLNHTQFYVLTGLQFKAFSNARYPVNVGPQVQASLSNLSIRSVGKQEHLTQYGLKISTVIK